MKYLTLIMLVAFVAVGSAAEVKWLGFDAGIEKALEEKKPVLIDFYTEWCHWCKVMDDKTFNAEEVAKKLSDDFVCIRLNAEDQKSSLNFDGKMYTNAEFTQALGVSGFPTLAFIDDAGQFITKVPGYVPAKDFVNILNYIDKKYYEKNMSFEEFLEKEK